MGNEDKSGNKKRILMLNYEFPPLGGGAKWNFQGIKKERLPF